MAVTFGLDLSHHQGANPDLTRARREGVEFVFLKSTEGARYVDSMFAANLDRARRAGLLVAAYHFVRSDASVVAQAANVRRIVPLDVPVIPDVEANSGPITLTRQLVDELRASGYQVPLLYLPRWYWQQIGSPDLRGLPPLWSSRYPDNAIGTLAAEYAAVPGSYWSGYGGLEVAVLQFTSSARVAGYAPLDANAYRGTRDGLSALLGATPTPSIEEDDMQLIKGDKADAVFVVYWDAPGAIAVRKKVPNGEDPGYKAALAAGYVVKTVPQAVIDAVPDAVETKPVVSVDFTPVIAHLTANPPVATVTPEAMQQIAALVVAEFKKEGN